LLVPDDERRLSLELGEARDDGVIVGEAPIPVDLGEAGEHVLDEVAEIGPVGMARHEHALPRRQRAIEILAHRDDTTAQLLDLAVARVGARQRFERLDLLEQDCNRFFEIEQSVRHQRSSTAPWPTICSTSWMSVGDGRTRICELTSTFTRRRWVPSPVSTSNDTFRSPRWREKISPNVSSVRRSAGRRRWIATSRAMRSRTL